MLDIQAKKEDLISGAFHMPDEERRRQRVNDILNIFNISPLQVIKEINSPRGTKELRKETFMEILLSNQNHFELQHLFSMHR